MSRARLTGYGIGVAIAGFALGAILRPFVLPHRAATVAAPARYDSVTIAELAVRRCGKGTWTWKMACYEGDLLPLVPAFGAARALTVLQFIVERDSDVASSSHAYAHAIGVSAYDADPDVRATFPTCREIFQSGCYHGVIQAYFMSAGTDDSAAVRGLCAPRTVPNVYGWLRFQCTHGLGHGLTMLMDHHLPEALQLCDYLADGWDRDSCYGGAFMENIMDATQPKDSMLMNHSIAGSRVPPGKFKQIERADPAYPCSILGARYRMSCWVNQVSIIEYLTDYDVKRTSDGCERAPEGYVRWCFIGLGTDLNGRAVGNIDSTLAMCGRTSVNWREWCYVGVAKNLVEVGARSDEGIAFCRRVNGRVEKMRCYEAVGEEISSVSDATPDRERMCVASEAEYLEACRFGAGILPIRPKTLPPAL